MSYRRRMRKAEREAKRRRVVAAANSYICGCGHSMAWHEQHIGWIDSRFEGPCGYPGCDCSGLDLRQGRMT